MKHEAITADVMDDALFEHAIDRFGAKCEADWVERRGQRNYTSRFLDQGYYIKEIPQEIADAIKPYFSDDNVEQIRPGPVRTDYVNARIDASVAEQLNARNTYYAEPGSDVVAALERYFETIAEDIEEQLGHAWRVGNVRAWSVKPNVEYGANIWHCDGFSRYVRKFLIFVNAPNSEAGTTEITTRRGDTMYVEAETPVCVLYDAAILSHRGRSPKSDARPIIEVTVLPAEENAVRCSFAGQLARVPRDFAEDVAAEMAGRRYVPEAAGASLLGLPQAAVRMVSDAKKKLRQRKGTSKTERKKPAITNLAGRLNLGGGRKWSHKGWINLEGVGGPANPFPMWFSDQVVFPIASSSIELAYSSHCLEHLDDATVERMLRETRRVLSPDGALVLKLPDCEEVIKRWREGDEHYFTDVWRFGKVAHTWAARGVDMSIDSRAAYIFCGFWNKAFGDHFDGKHKRNTKSNEAYNGPPVQIRDLAGELRELDSPHEIADRLRRLVIETEPDHTFNHQNAWSRKEMGDLLEACGFRVESFDAANIMGRHHDIPGVDLMKEISFYCRAVPA